MNESEKDDFQESAAENKKQLEDFLPAHQQENSPKATNERVPRLDTNTADQKCFNPKPQQQGINPHTDTKLSIFAGIGQDDNLIFELMGSEKTFSNLMGLESFISARIQQEKDKKLHTGDARLLPLFQLIQQLNAKVDALLSTLDRPSNKL